MNNEKIHKLDMKSKDIVEDNIRKISELFPDCINEGKIDFDMLKQELSKEIIDDGKERYQLTWVGKKDAIINANTPCNKTLRPVKEESVEFDNTENIYIEGDNLEVLKILQESYLNKIKCIYIDPPYNTGNDFIYNDKFVNENELTESGQIDEYNNKLVSNQENNGKFHSDWLSMMYSRLKLARNLLKSEGVIAISINKVEEANLRKMCDEIFGENNFLGKAIWRKNKLVMKGDNIFKNVVEPILFYGKNSEKIRFQYSAKENALSDFSVISAGYGEKKVTFKEGTIKFREKSGFVQKGEYKSLTLLNDVRIENNTNIDEMEIIAEFKWSQEKIYEKLCNNAYILIKSLENMTPRIYFNTNTSKPLDYIDEKYDVGTNESAKMELKKLGLEEIFSYPKPSSLINFILNVIDDKNAIILDFFSGSATTADSVMQMNSMDNGNRKYIMIQLPEKCDENSKASMSGYKTICNIGEERIRRAGMKIKEETNANIDYGFRVYKVDSSNMKDVYYAPTDLQQSQLNMFESNIKEDRTSEDLLTQVILDLGLTLDLSIEKRKIINNNVYFVENNSLVACFDDTIDINIVDEICKCNPLKIVFKESSFKTDSDKINVFERIKKLSNDTEINII